MSHGNTLGSFPNMHLRPWQNKSSFTCDTSQKQRLQREGTSGTITFTHSSFTASAKKSKLSLYSTSIRLYIFIRFLVKNNSSSSSPPLFFMIKKMFRFLGSGHQRPLPYYIARFGDADLLLKELTRRQFSEDAMQQAYMGIASSGRAELLPIVDQRDDMSCDTSLVCNTAAQLGHVEVLLYFAEQARRFKFDCCQCMHVAFHARKYDVLCHFRNICGHEQKREELVSWAQMRIEDEHQRQMLIFCLYLQDIDDPPTALLAHREWSRLSSVVQNFLNLVFNTSSPPVLPLACEDDPEFDISHLLPKKGHKKRHPNKKKQKNNKKK